MISGAFSNPEIRPVPVAFFFKDSVVLLKEGGGILMGVSVHVL